MSFTNINKPRDTGLKFLIGFFILVIIIGLILVFVYEKKYNDCKNNESPLCLTGNCPAQVDFCGASPFKYVNGDLKCKYAIFQNPSVPSIAPSI